MSNIYFILLAVICWQPIYLGITAAYHTVKSQTYDSAAYWTAVKEWFNQLWNLVFSKPKV